MIGGATGRTSWRRLVAINAVVCIALLLAIEMGARVFIAITRGSGTAGLQERTLNLEYEPFVMFGPGWDRRFAAVPRDDRLPVVLLIGASTAQNFAPDVLEGAIADRFHRPVRVVNAAYGGYEARQEAVVAALWAPHLAPAVIVTLDGHNDLEHRLRTSKAGGFFLDEAYRAYLTRPATAPVVWMLSHSQAYNGLARWKARRDVADWTRYADAIDVYVSAQRSINAVARGLGAGRLIVLQPFMGFKEPLAPEERAFTAYRYREATMRALYDRTAAALADLAAREDVTFLDARPIYGGAPAAIFSDDVHFRDVQGYTILARAIAGALTADVFDRASPRNP